MRVTTPLPPACLLHPPTSPAHLLIGSYSLSDGIKSGTITLYHITTTLTLLQTHPTPAILDIKFSPHNPHTFAASTHTGTIQLYTFHPNPSPSLATFSLVAETSVLPEEVIGDRGVVTSIAWHPVREMIAFTVTSGDVGVLDVATMTVVELERQHELEAWVGEYTADGSALYSGGDDSVLVLAAGGSVVWRERRTHAAGVTAVVSKGDRLVTGSYDEVMRVWDERGRKVMGEVGLGGGVWRVVEREEGGRAVAGMQAGPKLVKQGLAEGEGDLGLGVVKEWGDMNLCYGVAVHKEDPKRVGWCSFYDRILAVDEVDV